MLVAQIAHDVVPVLAALACIGPQFCGPYITAQEAITLLSELVLAAAKGLHRARLRCRPSSSCQGASPSEVKACHGVAKIGNCRVRELWDPNDVEHCLQHAFEPLYRPLLADILRTSEYGQGSSGLRCSTHNQHSHTSTYFSFDVVSG